MNEAKGPGRFVYQIEESHAGNVFEAFCPELVITAFGDNPDQAREALRSQVTGYLEELRRIGKFGGGSYRSRILPRRRSLD